MQIPICLRNKSYASIIIVLLLSVTLTLTLDTYAQPTVIWSDGDEKITYDSQTGRYRVWYESIQEDGSTVIWTGGFRLPNQVSPRVEGSAQFDEDLEEYLYSYSIENQEEAMFGLYRFTVLTLTEVEESTLSSPNSDWFMAIVGKYTGVRWAYVYGEGFSGIEPGNTLSGFSFKNGGLPAISDYRASNKSTIAWPDEGPNGTPAADEVENILSAPGYVEGRTISPRDIPSPFVQVDFLDDIISYNQESGTLEWIATSALTSNFDSQLQAARTNLLANDVATTANILASLLLEIEEEYVSTNLTDEAYALLRYNIEYLLNELPDIGDLGTWPQKGGLRDFKD